MSVPTQYNSPESTNQYGQPPLPPQMPFTPGQKPKSKRKWLMPVLIAVALIFGFGFGSAANPAPAAVETIKEVPVEKRVEVKVPVVPPSCAEAFDHAEAVFSSASRTVGIFQTVITAITNFDTAGIKAGTAKIDTETSVLKVTGPKYQSAKAKCLAG